MSQNLADSVRRDLKNAIKDGKTSCGAIASYVGRIIDEALWQYLNVPGETAADKFHALVRRS